jgi:hypothetical protein
MADPTLPRFNSREQMAVVPFFFMHEGEECVKVQIAGETRFAPVYRAKDMWERDGLQEITYAERWPEQYRQFKEGSAQIADGTSLEEAPFLNPSRIGELRALKIYSVESLANLDDRNIPRLGGKGYELKEMARQYLLKRQQTGAESKFAQMQAQIEALTARLAATESQPVTETADVDTARKNILRDEIKARTGSYPPGNPKTQTVEYLQRVLSETPEPTE